VDAVGCGDEVGCAGVILRDAAVVLQRTEPDLFGLQLVLAAQARIPKPFVDPESVRGLDKARSLLKKELMREDRDLRTLPLLPLIAAGLEVTALFVAALASVPRHVAERLRDHADALLLAAHLVARR